VALSDLTLTAIRAFKKRTPPGDPNSCWIFQGYLNKRKYGRIAFKVNKKLKREYAHRIAYLLEFGAIPNDKCVLHKCDNPTCCNPKHLFLGTRSDNMKDMYSKGRENPPSGESHCRAKLTYAEVAEIRFLRTTGISQNALSARFGVSRRNVRRILDGEIWKEAKKSCAH